MPGVLKPAKTAYFYGLYERYRAGESAYAIACEQGIDCGNMMAAWTRRGWTWRRDGSAAALLRYTHTTPEYRADLTAAAHAAVRGKPYSDAAAYQRALGNERTCSKQSPAERNLIGMLDAPVVAQKAIGPYNADIAVHGIAVEVLGGEWHGGSRTTWQQRTRYILNAGWAVVGVRVNYPREPLTINAAEYIIAFAEMLRGYPSARRQYRVIRGTGEMVIAGCLDDDNFPLKPPRRGTEVVRCQHDLIPG